MLGDPVTLRSEYQKSGHGNVRTSLQERIIPNGDGTVDPFAKRDLTVAKAITRMLLFHYPGHFWEVEVSHQQGIVKIAIPILMGPTEKWVERLSEDVTPRKVMEIGGSILERWSIPRSGLDLSAFLAARDWSNRTFSKNKTPR